MKVVNKIDHNSKNLMYQKIVFSFVSAQRIFHVNLTIQGQYNRVDENKHKHDIRNKTSLLLRHIKHKCRYVPHCCIYRSNRTTDTLPIEQNKHNHKHRNYFLLRVKLTVIWSCLQFSNGSGTTMNSICVSGTYEYFYSDQNYIWIYITLIIQVTYIFTLRTRPCPKLEYADLSFAPIFIRDAQCAESNGKSIFWFSRFLFFELSWKFIDNCQFLVRK